MSEPKDFLLSQRMAELARTLTVPNTLEDILLEVTTAAVELIPGVDTAGILLVAKGGKFQSIGGTDKLPYQMDELQMTFNEGPCVEAALSQVVVRTDDFTTEERWPRYAAEAVKAGIFSGLSLKLYTGERTAGALNLFGFRPNVWDDQAETVGAVLAAHAAAAVLASQQVQQLEAALLSRDRIGQAKGIIMERFGIDDVAAFTMLKQLSQETNTKLSDVAQRVVDTRHTGDQG